MGDSSIRIFFGVMWIILGIRTLARSHEDESDSNALETLFVRPAMKTDKQRGWETGAGIGCVSLGILEFVLAFLASR